MAFYDNILSKALDRIGVIRRSDLQNFLPASSLFSGETRPGAEWDVYANWSEQELQKLAITNPWVYSCVNIIGKEVALGTMQVEQRNRGDGEKWSQVDNHDFENIVEGRPNPYQGQFYTWLYQIMWLMGAAGEAYWMLVPDRTGQLQQIYPLPANRIKPIPDPRGERMYSGFAYTPIIGSRPLILPPEQVCFHKLPNIFDYHRGMSPLSAYLLSLQLDTESRKFDLEDFRNGLTLKHIISMRPETGERDKLVAEDDLKRGQKEGKRYMLIRAGQLDVKALENRRGDNAAVRALSRQEASYIYGVPDAMHDMSDTNRAGATEARGVFRESTIWPLMVMLAEDMTAQIINRFYADDLRVAFADIRPKNIQMELTQKESKRKVQTYNEARKEDGLDPHPDKEVGEAPFTIAPQVYLEKVKQTAAKAKQPPPQLQPEPQPAEPQPTEQPETELKAIKADDTPQEIKDYEAELMRLIEQAQNGQLDRTRFEELVGDATEAVLTVLFEKGAGGELTPEAKQALNDRIAADLASVPNLADDVFADKFKPLDEGGLGWSLPARVALWGTFAFATHQMSKVFGDGERAFRWQYDPRAEHCRDCLELNGQVKTASQWKATGIFPGSPSLECRGFCRCSLVEVAVKTVYEPVLVGSNGHAH